MTVLSEALDEDRTSAIVAAEARLVKLEDECGPWLTL
jgi:hypothetical protein